MKTLLKKTLTLSQYRALLRLKYEILPNLRYRLSQSPVLLLGLLMKILPDKSLVALKSTINVARRMDYDQCDIYLNIESDFEYSARVQSYKKEPETVEWIQDAFREGDVLYDIGANIGAYSLLAAKLYHGGVTVYAFEPGVFNFNQLCRNLVLNDCQSSVIPLQVALSDKTSVQTFNYHRLDAGSAMHALGEAVDGTGQSFQPVLCQPVLSFRLDDLIKQFNLATPNHIKLDVDGIEFSVLKGMGETLNDPSVRSMMLEINEDMGFKAQVIEFLESKGFRFHSKLKNYTFLRAA